MIFDMKPKPTPQKPLVILNGEIKTPPFSAAARIEAGYALRRLQQGETLAMPLSRPMPSIGARCAELRIVDADAVLVAHVFAKKTQATPKAVIDVCKARFKAYDELTKGA